MSLPLHPSCELIERHPSGLIAVSKSTGISSHPNDQQTDPNAILQLPYDHEAEAYVNEKERYYLLHRLDSPTSGALLLCTDAELADRVKAMFAEHQIAKTYVAVVKGLPRRSSEHWRDYIKTSRSSGKLRSAVATGPVNATTDMRLLERGSGSPARALIELRPHTGKTHQLRVQCASRHLPIIGDATYGDFSFNRKMLRDQEQKRMYLHCHRMQLKVRLTDDRIEWHVECPIPKVFLDVLA